MSFLRFGTVADFQSSQPGLLPDVQPAGVAAGGTVTSIAAGTGITVTPSPIVGAGTVAITPVGTAGTYGDATHVPVITTNASGQVSAVVPTAITFPASTISTQDEGVPLSSTVTTLNFVGAGVTAAGGGATTTVTIPGGGGSVTQQIGTKAGGAGRVVVNILAASPNLNMASSYTEASMTKTAFGATGTCTFNFLFYIYVANGAAAVEKFRCDLSQFTTTFVTPANANYVAYNYWTAGTTGTYAVVPWKGGTYEMGFISPTTLEVRIYEVANTSGFDEQWIVGGTWTWTY